MGFSVFGTKMVTVSGKNGGVASLLADPADLLDIRTGQLGDFVRGHTSGLHPPGSVNPSKFLP